MSIATTTPLGLSESSRHDIRNSYSFRDLARSSGLLCVFLWASLACTAVSLWSGILHVEFLQQVRSGVPVSEAEANAHDVREGAIGVVGGIVVGGTFILFWRWTYLANRNAWPLVPLEWGTRPVGQSDGISFLLRHGGNRIKPSVRPLGLPIPTTLTIGLRPRAPESFQFGG